VTVVAKTFDLQDDAFAAPKSLEKLSGTATYVHRLSADLKLFLFDVPDDKIPISTEESCIKVGDDISKMLLASYENI
jgi:hypothetical protein